ncbi:UNVERIFIED_CONTAM: Retrovirus-related Pol polyprotein from transposon RE2 [Sesamum radiatum]|uniref:Retrovirus-related Pol polyprotein from transposon RE2 n=1 Tax=Sesamum radiatum TaxID=300843 RepID=A0AAW2KCJ2_SESRA
MTELGESSRRVAAAETGEGSRQQMPETLHGSDHPGMVLSGTLLTKNNYLIWSYAVKRALRAKIKIGFIEAKTLWLDLEERYGECNGPLLYQLQREISSLAQGVFPFKSTSAPSPTQAYPSLPLEYYDDNHVTNLSPPITPPPTLSSPASLTPQRSPSPPPYVPPARRSQRISQKPSWLNDYVCTCSTHDVSNCSPSTYSSAHISFVALLSSMQKPHNYIQASKDKKWVEAMQHELDALAQNDTLPLGKKAIGSRWVFRLKLNADGSVQRHKARLVAKGYNQIEGIDYFDSFSPVAKSVTIRILLAIAAAKSWPLLQLDVKNAFLHGFLDEDVYMVPPEGYDLQTPGLVCKLKKSLYALKQDLGHAKYHLGLELARSDHADDGTILSDPGDCRRLVGCLLYLGFTRPDVSFAVQQLSQFLQRPRSFHWVAALHVLRYLKDSSSLGLFFPSHNTLYPSVFTNASWASCPDSRRSIMGFCIFLGSSVVSWKSKKQATVSRSSAKAVYHSMGAAVCELLWLSYLLYDLHVPFHTPISFWCDNKAAIHITANPVFHECAKHLDIDYHLVRNLFKCGFIQPLHLPGHDQLADLFTKSPPVGVFARLFVKLGLVPQAPS